MITKIRAMWIIDLVYKNTHKVIHRLVWHHYVSTISVDNNSKTTETTTLNFANNF